MVVPFKKLTFNWLTRFSCLKLVSHSSEVLTVWGSVIYLTSVKWNVFPVTLKDLLWVIHFGSEVPSSLGCYKILHQLALDSGRIWRMWSSFGDLCCLITHSSKCTWRFGDLCCLIYVLVLRWLFFVSYIFLAFYIYVK